MVNVGPLQTILGRICASLVIAGFLIRPATGCVPMATNLLEQCSNDLTFEGQHPMLDLSVCGCGVPSGEWLPATMDGAEFRKSSVKDLRSHTLPPSVCEGAKGKVFAPIVVDSKRSINNLVELSLHPTAEISHEGCPKRYSESPHFDLLDRIYNAVRSPVSRLVEHQTVLDPSKPPLAPEVVKGWGKKPAIARLDNHQCMHHPPTLRTA
uniref:Uncharacterized protein n=1 Tax=Hemiselmis andersenii TaxID=464988 RepID=A0A6U2B371_HEMAN|mmetsp:Transcript_1507/g.3625  ORF Transcript_1507/g.3625 Transcript_1507/m.3625 type:complete len:209 (+) Transcript_1507:171-797(+)|eukprot:CAMPEP_0114126118 /NCGR_PEP_ID=MMETSP0043_2-20121206/9658_1 /TAXON_ID=464988 /ORGANISM="Hemiselmis andersenii, Strain CCMP644" /LENGTH=208 /DNA_ID=CAMNT_0001219079 /DNA_START=160 /DNA_END=786 /DNA_ORIENTATION=-